MKDPIIEDWQQLLKDARLGDWIRNKFQRGDLLEYQKDYPTWRFLHLRQGWDRIGDTPEEALRLALEKKE